MGAKTLDAAFGDAAYEQVAAVPEARVVSRVNPARCTKLHSRGVN